MKRKSIFSIVILGASLAIVSCGKKDTKSVNEENVVAVDSIGRDTVVKPGNSADHLTKDQVRDLPLAVEQFLHQHYPNIKVNKYEKKNDATLGNYYDFKLDNGAELEIDEQGKWIEIKDSNGVPNEILLENIKNYVNTSHKGIRVTSIEREVSAFEVELENGKDLKFDLQGNYVK